MRGSWQPQGPEVWKGRDNRGLPVSWQPRLGARQPGHSPDWWAPGPELQTTGQPQPPSPCPIPYPGRVQPVRHEPPLTALCPHNHRQWLPVTPPRMDGQALIRLTHWEGEVFYFCYRVFVYVCLMRVCICVRVQVICQTTLSLAVSLFGLRACLGMYIKKVVCTARALSRLYVNILS